MVGGLGLGTLTIQGGGVVNSGGGGSIGLAAGSTGTVTVTGPGSTWNNSREGGLNIGSFGTGSLTIANGGTVVNTTPNNANIGTFAGSQGTVTVTGAESTWTNQFGVNVGNSGRGTLTIADGGIVNAGGFVVIATDAGAVGTLNIGAGVGDPAAAPGTLTASSLAFGAGTGTLNFNHTSDTYVFAPAISGTGTVNVLAGITTLTGGNSYDGATHVRAGTLRAGARNTFSPNSAATVASRGTLDLNGFDQILAGLANAGRVNMGTGTAPGTVLTTTSYTGRGGMIAMNTFLGGDNSPSDRLVINGGTASGTSGLRITNAGGSGDLTLGNGIPVVVATSGGTTAPGAFGLSGPVVAGPYEYFLFRGGVTPGNENDWFLRNVAGPIPPEPPGPTRPDPIPPGPTPPTPVPPTPVPPGLPGPEPVPFFRPEAVVYAGLPALARLIGKETLGTFHERQGDQSLLTKNGPLPIGWGRAFGATDRVSSRRAAGARIRRPSLRLPGWHGSRRRRDLAGPPRPFRPLRRPCGSGRRRARLRPRPAAAGQRHGADGCDEPWHLLDPCRSRRLVSRQRADAFLARRRAALEPRRRLRPRRPCHHGFRGRRLSDLAHR